MAGLLGELLVIGGHRRAFLGSHMGQVCSHVSCQ